MALVSARPLDESHESTVSRHRKLRERCLERDGNRCVITGNFNGTESMRRDIDDDGISLASNTRGISRLEVAHIIPHSLGWREMKTQPP